MFILKTIAELVFVHFQGDAENDVEMLEMSAIGVAVGNASSVTKNAADIVLPLTSSEGGVGMALEDILGV